MTGMFLQISCSITNVRSAYPDIDGKSNSVNIRSILWGLPFKVSHAFRPSGTAATANNKNNMLNKPFSPEYVIFIQKGYPSGDTNFRKENEIAAKLFLLSTTVNKHQ